MADWLCIARKRDNGRFAHRVVQADSLDGAVDCYRRFGLNEFVTALPLAEARARGWSESLETNVWNAWAQGEIARLVLGAATTATTSPGPRKPTPALPPEVWNTKPFDPEAAWKATRIAAGDPEKE